MNMLSVINSVFHEYQMEQVYRWVNTFQEIEEDEMFSFDQAKGITCVSSTIEKYKMNGENMDLVSELEISLIVSWKGCKNFNSKRCE